LPVAASKPFPPVYFVVLRIWPVGLASFGLQLPLVPACSLFAQLADGGAVMLDRLMRVLRAPASTLTQRNIVNDASQSGRRNPSTTLRDESGSRFDDRLIAVTIGRGKNGIHNRFRNRRLLASELAQIDVPFGIKCENKVRAPNNLHRLPALQFDDNIGCSYSLSGERGQAVTCRILQHSPELVACEPPNGIVTSNQEGANGIAH
jgi:hypothetical protein